jgi:hypothetical protein
MRRAKQPYVEIFWVVAGKPKLTLGNKATRADDVGQLYVCDSMGWTKPTRFDRGHCKTRSRSRRGDSV